MSVLPLTQSNETATILVVCTTGERQTHSARLHAIGLGLVVPVVFQTGAILFCLLSAMHPFSVDLGHGCKGFETIEALANSRSFLLSSSFISAGQLMKSQGPQTWP